MSARDRQGRSPLAGRCHPTAAHPGMPRHRLPRGAVPMPGRRRPRIPDAAGPVGPVGQSAQDVARRRWARPEEVASADRRTASAAAATRDIGGQLRPGRDVRPPTSIGAASRADPCAASTRPRHVGICRDRQPGQCFDARSRRSDRAGQIGCFRRPFRGRWCTADNRNTRRAGRYPDRGLDVQRVLLDD